MKRILFITAFVPSRLSAGENFSRQLINDLSLTNHIDLIFFKYPLDSDYVMESENVSVLRIFRNSFLIKVINFIMFPWLFPLFTVRFNIFRLLFIKKILRKNQYDLLFLDFSQTFLFGKFIKGIPLIFNSHDVIAQRYSRIRKGLFAPLTRFSEKYVLMNPEAKIFTLSEKDQLLIKQLYSLESTVASVYLDDLVINSQPDCVGDYYVFFANWNRHDNSDGLKWFFNFVYPELNTDIKFRIIGPGLPADILSGIAKYTNCEYMGFIDNPYPLISNARALLSPLFTGAGIKVKVIESLACGTPVIGTEISFEGVSEIYSQFLTSAENREDFITSINNFKFELSKKLDLKELFINSYQNKTISSYVESLENSGIS